MRLTRRQNAANNTAAPVRNAMPATNEQGHTGKTAAAKPARKSPAAASAASASATITAGANDNDIHFDEGREISVSLGDESTTSFDDNKNNNVSVMAAQRMQSPAAAAAGGMPGMPLEMNVDAASGTSSGQSRAASGTPSLSPSKRALLAATLITAATRHEVDMTDDAGSAGNVPVTTKTASTIATVKQKVGILRGKIEELDSELSRRIISVVT
jgi:hypothetical protein